jgi:hypothetical protein
LLRKGPVAVVQRVSEIESEEGSSLLTREVMTAVEALVVRLEDSRPPSGNAVRGAG